MPVLTFAVRAPGLDAGHHRLFEIGRQGGADAVDGVTHVEHRLLRTGLEVELDHHRHRAIGDAAGDVVEAGDAGDRVLDGPRDLVLQLTGRRAW